MIHTLCIVAHPHGHHPTKQSSCLVVSLIGERRIEDERMDDRTACVCDGRCRIEVATVGDAVLHSENVMRRIWSHVPEHSKNNELECMQRQEDSQNICLTQMNRLCLEHIMATVPHLPAERETLH